MRKEKIKFHFKINKYLGKNDGQCEEEVMSGFYSHRCPNKVKEKVDNAGLCKMHANSLRKWRN